MIRLDPKKCAQLTQIISPHYPNQQIMHLSDGSCDLHRTLYEVTKSKGFDYDLRLIEWETNDLDAAAHAGCTIEAMDLNRRQYNKHAKKYDNIFTTLRSETLEADLQSVLRKFYRILKNAGVLVMLIEKDSPLLQSIDQELENSYYSAVGHIDIFDDYEVITAKKLHGWGAYDVGF